MFIKHIFVLIFLAQVLTDKTCRKENKTLRYLKTKTCHRSNQVLISSSQVTTIKECSIFANRKKALAFNYSPPNAMKFLPSLRKNCEALGCPETGETKSLVKDLAYDYYSAYENSNVTENATCVKSVGLFTVLREKQNYLDFIEACQNMGADLADVTSEVRTKYLSQIINGSLDVWYKVAYVGLDDYNSHKHFVSVSGTPLDCNRYIGWAPGHPRFETNLTKHCVALDTKGMWRVVGCFRKLPAVCEFFPEPIEEDYYFKKLDCKLYANKSKINNCESQLFLWKIAKNSTRYEQCAIFNDLINCNNDIIN